MYVTQALTANKSVDIGTTLDVTGDTAVAKSDVSGVSVLHKSLTVTEAATLSSTLNVTKEATFNHNVVVSGDLTVNGTTTTINTTNTAVKDALMELSHGLASNEDPSSDSGFIIERGSSQNVFMGWDESSDMFIMEN